MRRLGRILGRVLLGTVVALGALCMFGPYEEIDLDAAFDARRFGEGVQVYFESTESRFDDIVPGVEKQVIWRPGFKEQRTPVSLLYVHGFSASAAEIRPVPDRMAEALGANLVFTRLTGHGRDGPAMATATVNDWMQDMAEGLAAARAVGERVVILATSTGAALATLTLLDPELSEGVAAVVFVSPNFRVSDPAARVLTWPAARHWVPLAVGDTRSFTPQNEAHGRYWTTTYPVTALLPMAALVQAAEAAPVEEIAVPALFWLSDSDTVVRPDVARAVASRWRNATVHAVILGPDDDPDAHVIAGDILSPSQNDAAVRGMLDWLKTQGIE